MTSREIITHSPKILTAYREAMGISVALLAKKTQISEKTLIEAEKQPKVFSVKQLKKVADALMVSEVQLLIDEVHLTDIPSFIDHRNQAQPTDEEQSYQLNKLLHQVHRDRESLLDVYELTDEESQDFTLTLTGNNALADAQRIRDFLKIEAAHLSVDGSDYYRAWRALLAQKDILVIEKPRLKIGSEGLALFYEQLPIIVILTSGQSHSRRLFTMLHELVHLGLRQSCIDGEILTDKQAIESYCNCVAGHVLVPEHIVSTLYDEQSTLTENIACIRKKTRASQQAIAIQLNLLGYIEKTALTEYFATLENPSSATQAFGIKKKHSVYNQYGRVYLQQVIGAVWQGVLNVSTAMNMLGLDKPNDLQYLKEKVFK